MSTNRLVSLERSALNKLRIDCIELDCEDVLKCDRIEIFSGSNDIDFTSARLTNVANPIASQDTATKQYVDDEISGVIGGGLNNPLQTDLLANNQNITSVNNLTTNSIGTNNTGSISITSDEVHNQRDIVDVFEIQTSQIGGISGSTMISNSNISMSGNQISDLSAPTLSGEVSTKGYTDSQDALLQSQITTNANNISTNTTSIANLTIQQNTNTSNITTNTNNISTNTSDITTLQNDLITTNNNVSTNTASINTNTNNIASNTTLATSKASINDAVNNSTTETWSNSKIQTELNAIGGSTDYTNIQGSVQKVNLQTATTQPDYGRVHLYTAHTNLSIGQPVLFHYGTNGIVDVALIGTLPDQHEIVGICLNTVSAGGIARILVDGYGTARITALTIPSSATVALTGGPGGTNGTTQGLTNNTTFTDSGSGSNYSSNENYSIIFDAGSGYTIDMILNDFAFEHTTTKMYDRLGVQGSNDNITYTNLNVPWFQRSDNDVPTYGFNFFASASWNSSGSKPGYIIPKDTPRAILLGSGSFPATVNTSYRYLKFFFISDSSATDDGWNITLQPNTPYPTGTAPFTAGATLYIDNTDFTKVSESNTSQRPIGFVAYNDSANDSVFCRIHPPSHS